MPVMVGHPGDAGLDLYCVEDQIIQGNSSAFIDLGIQTCATKEGGPVAWLLFPRSSIAKTPLRTSNSIGLIDAGYRGTIKLAVDNIRDYSFEVKRGDRLCQAVAFDGKPLTFGLVEDLPDSERGTGGFGSTNTAA